MSGDKNDSGSRDPLARLLFEPPTLVTDSLDFLLLVGVLPVLGHNPPSYVASQRMDLKELARLQCLEREPRSKIIDSKLTRYLSYLHGEGRGNIGDLHDHFATRYALTPQRPSHRPDLDRPSELCPGRHEPTHLIRPHCRQRHRRFAAAVCATRLAGPIRALLSLHRVCRAESHHALPLSFRNPTRLWLWASPLPPISVHAASGCARPGCLSY